VGGTPSFITLGNNNIIVPEQKTNKQGCDGSWYG